MTSVVVDIVGGILLKVKRDGIVGYDPISCIPDFFSDRYGTQNLTIPLYEVEGELSNHPISVEASTFSVQASEAFRSAYPVSQKQS